MSPPKRMFLQPRLPWPVGRRWNPAWFCCNRLQIGNQKRIPHIIILHERCRLDTFEDLNEGRFQHSWPRWLIRNPKYNHIRPLFFRFDVAIQIIGPAPAGVVGIPKFENERFMFSKQTLSHFKAMLKHPSSSHLGSGDFEVNCPMAS